MMIGTQITVINTMLISLLQFGAVLSPFQLTQTTIGQSEAGTRGALSPSSTQHMQHKRSQSFNHHLNYNQYQQRQLVPPSHPISLQPLTTQHTSPVKVVHKNEPKPKGRLNQEIHTASKRSSILTYVFSNIFIQLTGV